MLLETLFLNKAHSCSWQLVRGAQTTRGFWDFCNNLLAVKTRSMQDSHCHCWQVRNADNPGNLCLLVTWDLHEWSSTKWEPAAPPCQVPEHLSTAPPSTHPPSHSADAHMHHFICFPKDTVLPGKEFSNRTTLFRESCAFGKVKDISE